MKINNIWAYISEDENGNEGLCGWLDENTKQWLPMVAADLERVESLKPLALIIAKQTNKKVKLTNFTIAEEKIIDFSEKITRIQVDNNQPS